MEWHLGAEMVSGRFTVIVERSEDECFAYVPSLPGCTSGGCTQGEAIENVKEAIRLTLDYLRDSNLPVPDFSEMVVEVER
jgi:predicted RNase H-like HicB family nuclease